MSKALKNILALGIGLSLAACAAIEPRDTVFAPGIPTVWPSSSEASGMQSQPVADIGWRDFFTDERLREVIAQSLEKNRDLRVAVLNVERAHAQYRIQRADRVPAIGLQGQMTRSGGDVPVSEQFEVGLGVLDFELDFFGRVRNLSEAAVQRFFSEAANRRNAQLSLISEVANAWLTLGADKEQLRISLATLATYEDSLRLTQARYDLGGASALELHQTKTLVETARTDAARYRGYVAQDENALTLLAGGGISQDLLPDGEVTQVAAVSPLPAGIPAEVLLRRPDVMAAEHLLLASNANISAARAAFFPSISLTGSVGTTSSELSGLFDSGTRAWSFIPKLNLPIFQGGRLRANLDVANAENKIALAQYEKAIQSGFREAADGLALSESYNDQLSSQTALVEAANQSERLSQARYDAGLDSFLTLLDARRTAYAARQSLVSTQLSQQANKVALYKALGGGWHERSRYNAAAGSLTN
ncbi:efflux transporter outer membrane subunit|uniref:efflux transporter outer membrane subunit n=1 Tax=Stenotrophomonas sp. SbOxS2 TaxID=2723885 RepID=UPI0015D2A5C6|nr:efflux transporter outer membrane subunit [Stenotrophomonas sp. SbOxS2]NYT99429.1 efflux transporter outer membrane subunit [Stenotrophomonas sp. SbOxS2]